MTWSLTYSCASLRFTLPAKCSRSSSNTGNMAHECASNDENPTPFAWLDGTLRGMLPENAKQASSS